MNNKELQAARKLLMFEASEAAEHIGRVSTRTWQYWEAGRTAVPEDVESEIDSLLRMRREMIDEIAERIPPGECIALRYFNSFSEFVHAHPEGTIRGWRLHQSVAALFYTEGRTALS